MSSVSSGGTLCAPVYIADLIGLNANVYLELGGRWAVRDNVTVLTCQSLNDDLAFNVNPSKAVKYGNDPEELETACKRIVDAGSDMQHEVAESGDLGVRQHGCVGRRPSPGPEHERRSPS